MYIIYIYSCGFGYDQHQQQYPRLYLEHKIRTQFFIQKNAECGTYRLDLSPPKDRTEKHLDPIGHQV